MAIQADNNPYSAPPAPPVPEPAESGNADKELPCHYCGMLVAIKANRCPHCGSRPQFERLNLIISSILIAGVMFGYMSLFGRRRDFGRWELMPVFLVTTFLIAPPLGWVLNKIGGNKW